MLIRWAVDLGLLLVGLWLGNLTLFHWWAAGGPPSAHHETYAFHACVFFVLTCLFLVAFVVLFVMNILRMRKG